MEEEEEEEERNLVKLLKWAADAGITDSTNESSYHSCLGHSLTVSHFPEAGGRGLAAVRDLRKGELILRVPKSALMTADNLLRKDAQLSSAADRFPYLCPTQILAVCLLYEMGKGKSSRWHPYLMNLPRSYDILATFGEVEKLALQVDDAVWTAEKAILKAETEWREASRLMEELKFDPKLASFKAWLWAFATISSRSLHIPWDKSGCLCPVGDLFNYAAPGDELDGFEITSPFQNSSLPEGDTTDVLDLEKSNDQLQRLTDGGFVETVNSYCFYARQNYIMGEQVLLSYGTYTNLELLEHYGFILRGNPNDKVFVSLEPGMYSLSTWPKDSQYIHPNGEPSFALVSALRLWATPQNQRRSVGHLVYSGIQLSIENEISVIKWIWKKCHVMLKNLPTSIEEDELLLSRLDKIEDFNLIKGVDWGFGGEVNTFVKCASRSSIERWKLGINWRLRYKNTLLQCISHCRQLLSSLSSNNVVTH